MGGPGSGNWYRWNKRDTTDEYHQLDVRELYRRRLLTPFFSGTSRWRRGERETGSIGWRVIGGAHRPSALELSYTVNGAAISYRVPLTWTPCHYGGERPWFLCPGIRCGRRVAVLYGGRYFLCRQCHQLVYESTRESAHNRALHKAQKIRIRLGGSASIDEPFPEKPKGMHWQTYWRLLGDADEAEYQSWVGLLEWLEKSDARIEQLRQR